MAGDGHASPGYAQKPSGPDLSRRARIREYRTNAESRDRSRDVLVGTSMAAANLQPWCADATRPTKYLPQFVAQITDFRDPPAMATWVRNASTAFAMVAVALASRRNAGRCGCTRDTVGTPWPRRFQCASRDECSRRRAQGSIVGGNREFRDFGRTPPNG